MLSAEHSLAYGCLGLSVLRTLADKMSALRSTRGTGTSPR